MRCRRRRRCRRRAAASDALTREFVPSRGGPPGYPGGPPRVWVPCFGARSLSSTFAARKMLARVMFRGFAAQIESSCDAVWALGKMSGIYIQRFRRKRHRNINQIYDRDEMCVARAEVLRAETDNHHTGARFACHGEVASSPSPLGRRYGALHWPRLGFQYGLRHGREEACSTA